MRLMANILSIVEIILFCLGGTLLIYRPRLRVSEALSSGIVVGLISLSCIFQASFLIGQPSMSFILEGLTVIGILFLIKQRTRYLSLFYQSIKSFCLENRLISLILFFAWLYLALQAILLPPGNWDSMTYNLARVLLFQQEKSLYLNDVTTPRQAIFPVGSDILHHIFLRFYNDYGIGIFSFLAYLSVVLGTYALSQKYASPKISLMSTLVISSLPEFVYQSTSTKNDIMTVAVAIFCFLTVHRLLENLNLLDVCLLILGFCFGISAKTTFMAFLIPFVVFFGILLFKKYNLGIWLKLIWQNRWYFIFLVIPVFILSQIWLFIHNHNVWGGWSGSDDFSSFHQHQDGLKAALANLIRYLFQSIHLLPPGDILWQKILGFSLREGLKKIYNLLITPLMGTAGMHPNSSFNINWSPNEDLSWFGLWGWLLIIPGVIYSAIIGRKFLRAVSFTLLSYIFIVSYKVAWMPWNNRFMSLFFASSGVCVAYLMNSLNFSKKKWFYKLINFTSLLMLVIALMINSGKPLIINPNQILTGSYFIQTKWPYTIINNSIWAKTNFGTNRLYYAESHYGDDRVSQFMRLIPPDSKVALVTGGDSWVYHYLLFNPDIQFITMKLSSLNSQDLIFDYLLCLDVKCNVNTINSVNIKTLWQSQKSTKEGQLIQLL